MTNNEIIGQFIKFMNALLDKIEPAMNNGLISQEERTQLASIAERVAALEQKEDKVGVSSEEMGQAIATAISLLPPDQVGVSEERVEELIAGIESYNDAELREKIRNLENREDQIGITEEQAQQLINSAISALPADQVQNAEQVRTIVEPLLQALPKVQTYNDAELVRRIEALEQRPSGGISEEKLFDIVDRKIEENNEGLVYVKGLILTMALSLINLSDGLKNLSSNNVSEFNEFGRKIEEAITPFYPIINSLR